MGTIAKKQYNMFNRIDNLLLKSQKNLELRIA